MSKFFKGFVFGTFSTLAAIAGSLYAFHQIVIQPIEDQENRAAENKRRAQRKQLSAHHN
ncbi:DUF3042 family protein [Pediococcus claussenii]|uniref:DUF3042 domain-containing protein n=1 Tax=Pediococcus claussenii (strain ATCC BAA-344 / DSM 14800 / JCM 18046 / KCTC 3811 / LMG 21948 / P06) TaxID=701521 RepID=G8PDM6_PEDCP|nr:DUF3042 family protein [Pediococcus claussenii]AEV95361.1 hypothetical protein PECL_1098 [Pediococcus claussenii ATCC BAA-344]